MQVKSIITMIFQDMPPMQIATPHDSKSVLEGLSACLEHNLWYTIDVVNKNNNVKSEKQILFPAKAISISVIDYNDLGLILPEKKIQVVQ